MTPEVDRLRDIMFGRRNAEEAACKGISTDALEDGIIEKAMRARADLELIQKDVDLIAPKEVKRLRGLAKDWNDRNNWLRGKVQDIKLNVQAAADANVELDHVDLVSRLTEILGGDDAV